MNEPARADVPRASSADWGWLGAILSIALVLRLINLNSSLWYDEVLTLVHYTRLPMADLLTTYPSLNHHVLFTLEARAAILLFGESAWALRLPAVIFGVASIWALWLVAREVVPPWEARLSALLLAVSYHHVWFSQNARGYTGMLFWGLLATYFMMRGARVRSWRAWTAYGLAGALAIYTHLSAVFFIAAQGLVYLVVLSKRFAGARHASNEAPTSCPEFSRFVPLYGFALAGLLALLFHAPLIPQMISTFTEATLPLSPADAAPIAQWKSPLWMIAEIGRTLGPLVGLALPVLILVMGCGMVGLWRKAPLLPATVLVHIPLTLALLVAASMRVWPRYFVIDIGLICLFLIHGTFVIGRFAADVLAGRLAWGARLKTLPCVLAALGIAASIALLPRNYLYPKQDLAGARDYVEAHRSGDSVVLTLGLGSIPYADYYAPHWREIRTVEELIDIGRSTRQVWLVYAFPGITEGRNPEIVRYLASNFERVRRFPGTLSGGDVIVLKSSAD
jgi:mannosyltransferase